MRPKENGPNPYQSDLTMRRHCRWFDGRLRIQKPQLLRLHENQQNTQGLGSGACGLQALGFRVMHLERKQRNNYGQNQVREMLDVNTQLLHPDMCNRQASEPPAR